MYPITVQFCTISQIHKMREKSPFLMRGHILVSSFTLHHTQSIEGMTISVPLMNVNGTFIIRSDNTAQINRKILYVLVLKM